MSVLWSSASVEWSTPADLFDRLDRRHHFTLDAAAMADNAKVANWLGPDHPDPERHDALVRDWAADSGGGTVYLNPPYGKSIGAFMAKANTVGVKVVCLLPARVDTKWFHQWCLPHDVQFLDRRLRFNGHAKDAPFPSCLVVIRNGSTRYECGQCGATFVPRRSDARYCSGSCRVAAHRARSLRHEDA